MKNMKEHDAEVEKVAEKIRQFSNSNSHKKLRFYHGSTNSTRIKDTENYVFIDISKFNDVIEINTDQKYAIVEPNVPMDKLVKATLQYGLLPPVVMEFPGITCGGAINGGALESSSYKYGQFNDSCIEFEIITGDGKIIHATSKSYHDLFYGISGSYGTLGFIGLIKMRLIPVKKYVRAAYFPTPTVHKTLDVIAKEIKNQKTDYIEGIIFDPQHAVVITGKLVDSGNLPLATYSRATDDWFYEKARKIAKGKVVYEELIPIEEYLFRYNRGAFWMGEYVFPYLHFPSNRLTKFLLNPVMNTRKLFDAMHAIKHSQDYFIQDFYCPFEKSEEFILFSDTQLEIYPIWVCPIKPAKTAQKLSPHYIPCDMLLDIGIWGQTKKYLQNPLQANQVFETYAKKTHSRKMLYAQSYYSSEEFWKIYDRKWYAGLRKKYESEKIFPDVWEKVHVSGKYNVQKWKGTLKLLFETVRGKNINK